MPLTPRKAKLPRLLDSEPTSAEGVPSPVVRRVERFGKTTRWVHWCFVLPFLGLAATGAALALREMLGLSERSVDAIVFLHGQIAVAWVVLPPIVLLSGQTRETLDDLLAPWHFSRSDLRWLLLQPLAALGRAELPPAGKLNGGQKLNAILTVLVGGGLLVSGTWLWFVPAALAAWGLHLTLFAVWVPAFCGHFYLAALNPGTRHALRAMFVGTVDRSWAEHHHPAWIAGLEGSDAPVPLQLRAHRAGARDAETEHG